MNAPPPFTVAAKLGGPTATTELALTASAVVHTPDGPAVHLSLEEVYALIEELAQVAQFHERTPVPAPGPVHRSTSNHMRTRAAAEALGEDFPRGPWYRVKYGTRKPVPGACACCKETIVRQAKSYYLLVDDSGHWTDAALHVRCAQAVQRYRHSSLDLIDP